MNLPFVLVIAITRATGKLSFVDNTVKNFLTSKRAEDQQVQ